LILIAALVSLPATTLAGQQPERSNPAVVLVGGQYGSPTRIFGSAGVLIAPPKPLKAHRVSGAGTKDTIFTWGVGIQIPVGW
jgi:hypothetical protein